MAHTPAPCPVCHGSGRMTVTRVIYGKPQVEHVTCSRCGGSGRV